MFDYVSTFIFKHEKFTFYLCTVLLPPNIVNETKKTHRHIVHAHFTLFADLGKEDNIYINK